MKKYFVLFLLLLVIPIRANASERWLISYVKDMDRNASEVVSYGKIEYDNSDILSDKEDKDNIELLDASVFSNKQVANVSSSNSVTDLYMLLVVISLVAVVLSSSKRFIDIGR